MTRTPWTTALRLLSALAVLAVVIAVGPTSAASAQSSDSINVAVNWSDTANGPTSQVALVEFDMFGVSWDTGHAHEIEYRLRGEGGTWSDWQELAVDDHIDDHSGEAHAHDGDVGAHDGASGDIRSGTALVYSGRQTGIQVRAEQRLGGAIITLIDTTPTTLDRQLPDIGPYREDGAPLRPDEYSNWDGPAFVRDREQWDTEDCIADGVHLHYAQPKAVVIHHTDGQTNYSSASVPAILRGLCNYAVNVRGFDDFMYNFVVDRYGRVWEGRTDSKTSPIIGAHTGGFNSKLQGVVMLGTFSSTMPTTAMRDGVRQITDWLTGWYTIDPTGTVTMEAGPTADRYEEGEIATVLGVIGHRDLGSTTCPGQAFYSTFPSFRNSIQPIDFGVEPSDLVCRGQQATIVGTPGDDVIEGTDGADVIVGLGGDDIIRGLGGDDVICTAEGADRIYGGPGRDTLDGGVGADTIFG